MALITDLITLKTLLEIDPNDTQEDIKLMFILETVSSWIQEWTNRPGLFFASRTEYYKGTGTQKLLLKSRPVSPDGLQVYVDQSGLFGAASGSFASTTLLTYGLDYTLDIDQSDGTSRSGILYRVRSYWPKSYARQAGWLTPFQTTDLGSVKVVYSGGYTINNLPAQIRMAANLLIAKLRYILPLGVEIQNESYEERSIGLVTEQKLYLYGLVKPWLVSYRNWSF